MPREKDVSPVTKSDSCFSPRMANRYDILDKSGGTREGLPVDCSWFLMCLRVGDTLRPHCRGFLEISEVDIIDRTDQVLREGVFGALAEEDSSSHEIFDISAVDLQVVAQSFGHGIGPVFGYEVPPDLGPDGSVWLLVLHVKVDARVESRIEFLHTIRGQK